MVITAKIAYFVSLLLICYTYIGYGIVMAVWAKLRAGRIMPPPAAARLPEVTVVIPAYNEAPVLGAKIRNTLELNYPANAIHILGAIDSSGATVR
jgi:poly-beta-1,6-N-acetyl-D-glucosamine synthase